MPLYCVVSSPQSCIFTLDTGPVLFYNVHHCITAFDIVELITVYQHRRRPTMHSLGSTELIEDVQKKDLCVDCGACVGLCPYFVSHQGKIARLFPCTLPQGRCYAHCPKTQVDMNELSMYHFGKPFDLSALGHVKMIKKAKAGPAMGDKSRFQNGGTVSALVTMAMKEGHIHAAALTKREGINPVPFLARTPSEVLDCCGSKYMASPTLASVTKETANSTLTMAVVGTPCQMTALAKMRMNPLGREDFRDPVAFAIGLFCTWALDTRRLSTLLNGKIDPVDILSMDVPPPPAQDMVFKTSHGTVPIPLSEIRTIIPKGCTICPDMTAEFSDLSVGALEGEPGWNTLIIRTARGEKLAMEALEKGYLIMEDMPGASLANLEKGAMGKKKKALARATEDQLLNLEPDKGRSALIIEQRLVDACLS